MKDEINIAIRANSAKFCLREAIFVIDQEKGKQQQRTGFHTQQNPKNHMEELSMS